MSRKHDNCRLLLVTPFLLLPTSFQAVRAGGNAKDEKPTASSKALDTLKGLSWMHGEWVAQLGDDTLEEIWSAPAADSLMGMFRWIKSDRVWMFELMTITADGDDVTFRLKHFDSDMNGWEQKDESLTAALGSAGESRVVFEGRHADKPLRFVYSREKDELVVQIGEDRPTTIRFKSGRGLSWKRPTEP